MRSDTLRLLRYEPAKDEHEELHNRSLRLGSGTTVDEAILQMIDALNMYARAFKTLPWNEDGSPVGSDSYASPYFLDIAKGVEGLFNIASDRRRFQYAKLHEGLMSILHTNGYTEEETA